MPVWIGYHPPTVTNIANVSVFLISLHRIYKILHTKYNFILIIIFLKILNISVGAYGEMKNA
jgi:hypothetical protein